MKIADVKHVSKEGTDNKALTRPKHECPSSLVVSGSDSLIEMNAVFFFFFFEMQLVSLTSIHFGNLV